MIRLFIPFFLLSFSLFAQSEFPTDFVFGVANAPGQVEDHLEDIWLDWGNAGHIRTWKNTPSPEKRLSFWTSPETEINLAKDLGANSFRMGIDWGRVMPRKNEFNETAIARYRDILKQVRFKNMKVMLTLWHHSVPRWIQAQGGWHSEETKKDFVQFASRMMKEFHNDVDWWLTFNEANVFVTMAYTVGIWPPGEKNGPLALFALGPFRGSSVEALDRMAEAHNEVYEWAHKMFPKIQVGLAHNMANYTGKSFFDRMKARYVDQLMNWRFPEKVKDHMDFFGFNYYGAEWLKGTQVDLDPEEEYSEAGRAVDVNGLYKIIQKVNEKFPNLPIIITENGIADAKDAIRPAYLIEHLEAVRFALRKKIPVKGYYVWSLTDNLEWSDGYCPKFGLVAVDRHTMERKPRMSFDVYKRIIRERDVAADLRKTAWDQVLSYQGKDHPFCRGDDGITAFDEPKMRKFSRKDWRFNPLEF